VQIQLKFEGQALTENEHYKYTTWFDDRKEAYVVEITFYTSGNFKPEYYFNLQLASSLSVVDGPLLFVVEEPICKSIVVTNSATTMATDLKVGEETHLLF